MHEHFETRWKELSKRLEIKSSQQAAWDDYSNLIKMLADQQVTKPNDDADTATISHRRTERAAEFSKRLARIAYTTSKFQTVLTEEQQKILHVLNFEWVMLYCRQQVQQGFRSRQDVRDAVEAGREAQ